MSGNSQRYQRDLAYIHHVGFTYFARRTAPWVLSALRRAGIHDGTVVELGCGSGFLLSALSAAGYQAVGIDSSAAMLELASSTAPGATLLHGSLYDVVLPPCRAVLAMGEPLSYVSGPGASPATTRFLSQAKEALPPGGLLLFDAMIRTRARVKPYRTWASGPDWACLVDVQPHSNGCNLRRAITMFRQVGDAYRRGEEEHWLHLFSLDLLTSQIERAGFAVRTASGYGRVRLLPGRRLFHCLKRAPSPKPVLRRRGVRGHLTRIA